MSSSPAPHTAFSFRVLRQQDGAQSHTRDTLHSDGILPTSFERVLWLLPCNADEALSEDPTATITTTSSKQQSLAATTATIVKRLLLHDSTRQVDAVLRFVANHSHRDDLVPPTTDLMQTLSHPRRLQLLAAWWTKEWQHPRVAALAKHTLAGPEATLAALFTYAVDADNTFLYLAILQQHAFGSATQGSPSWHMMWRHAVAAGSTSVLLPMLQHSARNHSILAAQTAGLAAIQQLTVGGGPVADPRHPELAAQRLRRDSAALAAAVCALDSESFNALCVAAITRQCTKGPQPHTPSSVLRQLEVQQLCRYCVPLTRAATQRTVLSLVVAAGYLDVCRELLLDARYADAWKPWPQRYRLAAMELCNAASAARAPAVLMNILTWHNDRSGAAFRAVDMAFHTGSMAAWPAVAAYMAALHPELQRELGRKAGIVKPPLGVAGAPALYQTQHSRGGKRQSDPVCPQNTADPPSTQSKWFFGQLPCVLHKPQSPARTLDRKNAATQPSKRRRV